MEGVEYQTKGRKLMYLGLKFTKLGPRRTVGRKGRGFRLIVYFILRYVQGRGVRGVRTIRQGIQGGETGRVWRRNVYDGRLPLLTIRFEARGGGGGGKKRVD